MLHEAAVRLIAIIASIPVVAALVCPIAVSRSNEWDEAATQIVMLSPTQFPELPKAIVNELTAKGCAIPQPWGESQKSNVISGSFAAAGQTDIAVLCSRQQESAIFVFWGGPARCSSELAKNADRNYLQGVSTGTIGYSRMIRPTSMQFISSHYVEFGGPRPPGNNHMGIEDAFLGKASSVHFCHEGKWIELAGAD